MKRVRIAVVLLLSILLVSGFACGGERHVSGTIEITPEFKGILDLEYDAHWQDSIWPGRKEFGGEVFMWNMGTETIRYTFEIYFYDSRGRLLDKKVLPSENEASIITYSIEPGGHTEFYAGTAYPDRVSSYQIIIEKDTHSKINWY